MTPSEIFSQRLSQQQLVGSRLRSASAVVGYFGAIQAQEYAMAKWAIGLRLPGSTDAEIEAAFNAGQILRTHVLRPTWHFVAPADLRWMLALTAPRVHAASAYLRRRLDLDAGTFRRCHAVLRRALRGSQFLTRAELQEEFKRAKLPADGERAVHLLMHAEFEGVICSGPRRGRQFTYALLDERVPKSAAMTDAQALAELTRRYFTSRAPATAQDFAWWSGLTLTTARAAIAALGSEFRRPEIAGRDYVLLQRPRKPAARANPLSCLLPDYDESGIAYSDRSAHLGTAHGGLVRSDDRFAFNRLVLIRGTVAGSWRRTEAPDRVLIEMKWTTPPTKADQHHLAGAVSDYGRFLGKAAALAET